MALMAEIEARLQELITKRSGNKFVNAGKRAIGRNISRALTGGKYDSLRGLSGEAKLRGLANGVGRGILRGVGRAAGVAGLGAAGLVVGAATAMATGDIKNLSKATITGITAGYNRGGGIADWTSDKIGGAYSDVTSYLALEDKGFADQKLGDDAIAQFHENGIDLTDEDISIIKAVAPYKDLKGDDDLLKAYKIAYEENGGVFNEDGSLELGDDATSSDLHELIEQTIDDVSLAKSYGDLKESNIADSFIRNEGASAAEVAEPAKATDADADARIDLVSEADARAQADKERKSRIRELEKERAGLDHNDESYQDISNELNTLRGGTSDAAVEETRRRMVKEKIDKERADQYEDAVKNANKVAADNNAEMLRKYKHIQEKTLK